MVCAWVDALVLISESEIGKVADMPSPMRMQARSNKLVSVDLKTRVKIMLPSSVIALVPAAHQASDLNRPSIEEIIKPDGIPIALANPK